MRRKTKRPFYQHVHDEIRNCLDKFGNTSIPYLQRKTKMSADYLKDAVNQINKQKLD